MPRRRAARGKDRPSRRRSGRGSRTPARGEAGRSAPCDDLSGELAARLVDHLAVQHHRAPVAAVGEGGEDRPPRGRTPPGWARRRRSGARAGRDAAPTCRRSRARARGAPPPPVRRGRRHRGAGRRSPAVRPPERPRAPSRAPSATGRLGSPRPARARARPTRSAYPMISASSRGLAPAISCTARRPAAVSTSACSPTRESAPSSRSTASRSSALSTLGTTRHVSAAPPSAARAATSSAPHSPARRVDPDRDRRGVPRARPQGGDCGGPRFLLALGHNRVLEVDHHLVSWQATRLLEHPLRACRAPRGTSGATSSTDHSPSWARIGLPGCERAGPRRTESGGGDTREGPGRRAALRGLRGGAGLRGRARADAHRRPRRPPSGIAGRPHAPSARCRDVRGRDRRGAAPRAPEPRMRRRDRPVDRPDPARARKPLLPRAGASAARVHRRHAAHSHGGRRPQAEPAARDARPPDSWRCESARSTSTTRRCSTSGAAR